MIALQLIQGMAVVLFVAAAGLIVCLAIDSGIEHRAVKRAIRSMRPRRAPLTLTAALVLLEIRARTAYGQVLAAIHYLSERRRHDFDFLHH